MDGEGGVHAGFAADAATGGGEDVAGEPVEVDFLRGGDEDIDDAGSLGGGGAEGDLEEIGRGGDDAFGEEEAGGEFAVAAGAAHDDGDGAAVDADFEGSFDGDGVGERVGEGDVAVL